MGLIAIPIITRLLSPEDYGNYVITIATVSVFVTIVGWLSMSIIRFYPAYERDGKLPEFYSTVTILTIVSTICVCLVFVFTLASLKSRISSNIFFLMKIGILVLILLSFFEVFVQFFRSKRQVNWYTGFLAWKNITILGLMELLMIKL